MPRRALRRRLRPGTTLRSWVRPARSRRRSSTNTSSAARRRRSSYASTRSFSKTRPAPWRVCSSSGSASTALPSRRSRTSTTTRCSSTTRTPKTTRTSAAGPRATGRSTRVPGTASRTTSTSSASAGRARFCWVRTATRRWPEPSGCSRSAQEQPRWRSPWPASPTCSSGRELPGSSCAADCSHGCNRKTSCSSCCGGATSAAAGV